ncbi:AraC family transcriptional regulator [Rhizobium sp. CF142]|uniref:AraC family transcriptional regulator n=1 Tax=Rhizobium sp. CF142 TaxID=1144314 RepID=UPI000566849B|nr:AraC family transcriptional regulator [Rhizobium sp. CF142]
MIDPLSDMFSLVDIESARCTRFEVGGQWAFRFPPKSALKFVAVIRGECWIILPGEPPFALAAGDTFLLANAPDYVIANDLQSEPEDGIAFFDWEHSNIARHGGDETALIGGSFVIGGGNAQLLLDALPPFIHIPAGDRAAAVLCGTLATLDDELGAGEMGSTLMTRRMGDILLVQALRAHVARVGPENAGWIGALGNPVIGKAISLVHNDPGYRWTVGELASRTGMSRSAFAQRFRDLVGIAPLDYVTRWRMHRAREALRRRQATVAGLAASLGYSSESAFGNAFKRVFGRAPKRYWQDA